MKKGEWTKDECIKLLYMLCVLDFQRKGYTIRKERIFATQKGDATSETTQVDVHSKGESVPEDWFIEMIRKERALQGRPLTNEEAECIRQEREANARLLKRALEESKLERERENRRLINRVSKAIPESAKSAFYMTVLFLQFPAAIIALIFGIDWLAGLSALTFFLTLLWGIFFGDALRAHGHSHEDSSGDDIYG